MPAPSIGTAVRSTRSTMPSPGTSDIEHSQRVAARVAAEIERAGGWIPFDRYVELVLYEPELGYYASGTRKFGDSASGGDFVTAPEISPLFAQALAAQLAQLFQHVPARIVEFGAGSGALAADLMAALDGRGVALERYSIVEISSDLQERQRQRLHATNVEWLTAPPVKFEGAMLANEVLDVMPFKLFAKRAGAIVERGVVNRNGGFAFDERNPSRDMASALAAIEGAQGDLPDGFASEVNLVAESWMRSSADWLARGALLVIDYGFPQREYYHPHRLMGTMMCHFRHHAHGDPLWMPGLNDVTVHVDFSAMASAAHAAGLQVLGYTSQAHFLLNCGVLDQLHANPGGSHERIRQTGALHRLISEAEMGELVKVLCVGRDIDATLLGFARGDRRHML
ncbi:MAG: SAM-dependent methyltransferase [Burkholderiaceae bacterium]|nr:SAM-dependent methyltransferase [Burkholderiaceae bacterium]